jgi:hypothetical protein
MSQIGGLARVRCRQFAVVPGNSLNESPLVALSWQAGASAPTSGPGRESRPKLLNPSISAHDPPGSDA